MQEVKELKEKCRNPYRRAEFSAAYEKIKEWMAEGAVDHDWAEYSREMWVEVLESVGFDNAEVFFSGFWSQGDGACFTADINLETLIKFLSNPVEPSEVLGGKEDNGPFIVNKCNGVAFNPKFARLLPLVAEGYIDTESITHSGNYYHSNSVSWSMSLRDRGEYLPRSDKLYDAYNGGVWKSRTPKLASLVRELEASIERLRDDLCDAIYKFLEEEYEWLQKEENLLESAEANGYQFDSEGEMTHRTKSGRIFKTPGRHIGPEKERKALV